MTTLIAKKKSAFILSVEFFPPHIFLECFKFVAPMQLFYSIANYNAENMLLLFRIVFSIIICTIEITSLSENNS